MSGLLPFSPDSKCPKCGYDGISTRYRWDGGNSHGYQSPSAEWLSRRCDRCEYRWDEACVASVETPS